MFDEVLIDWALLSAIRPNVQYAPFFSLDRNERFNNVSRWQDWLPGQESGQHYYTPVLNPRAGKPFAVPALSLPGEPGKVRV